MSWLQGRRWLLAPLAISGFAAAGVIWALVSPLFIRPTLIEPAAGTSSSGLVPDGQVLGRGTFDERDTVHKGSGDAVLLRGADGKPSLRLENFSVTNGPDLFVYLSGHPRPTNSGELHRDEANLGRLKAPQGSFSYEIDASVDLSKVKSIVIYCRAFSVIFSSAELKT